jgi:pseudouridine-5'-monophosphatase
MDGLLINTEDIYTICHNILLARYSAGPMAWSIKSQLQGRPAHEAIDLLLTWANLKGVVSPEEYTKQLHVLQEQEFRKAEALPGVEKLLGDLATAKSGSTGKKIHVALATSSHKHHFEIKTGHLEELFGAFVEERRILGDDARIAKGRGKPCPDIYLLALMTINDSLAEGEEKIKPEECLVFEDGIPGVVAGRKAGMRVVWVPHPGLAVEYQGKEAEVLAGLGEGGSAEEFGKVGDGYGEQLVSLEHFPYARYGIVTSK